MSAAPRLQLDEARLAENAGQAVELLKSLANRHRLMILCALTRGESSVGELNRVIDLSQSALSQHLAVLRAEGLVATRRGGQTVYYSLTDSPALRIIETLHHIYCS